MPWHVARWPLFLSDLNDVRQDAKQRDLRHLRLPGQDDNSSFDGCLTAGGGVMRPYRDIATLAGAQIVCFVVLTHLEPNFFLLHFYQLILYIAILVMLSYREERWAYMIGMLASVVWLVMAYATGMIGSSLRQLLEPRAGGLVENPVGIITLLTALIGVLMIAFCARHWKKEYSGVGKTRSTLLVSSGIVAVYYGILIAWFWNMFPKA